MHYERCDVNMLINNKTKRLRAYNCALKTGLSVKNARSKNVNLSSTDLRLCINALEVEIKELEKRLE